MQVIDQQIELKNLVLVEEIFISLSILSSKQLQIDIKQKPAYYVGFEAFMGDDWDIEEAKSWTVTNTQCPKTKYSVTRCGKTQILGGYNCLAENAQISRSFTLPHHWSIYIKVTFWLIDSWDSEYLIMKLGNIEIKELREHSPYDDNLCGATGNWAGLNKQAYLDRKYDKTLENNPHYERAVTAVFTSNLDGKADDESFGINNFQLLIDPCNPTCNQCLLGPESFNCLNCWDNATFIKYKEDYILCTCSPTEFYYAKKGQKCKKDCPITSSQQGFCKCNQGYYTVSKNVPCNDPICTECKKCDSTCKDCSGSGPYNCITCANNLYKQTYAAPDVPSTHPNYGKTICQDKCLDESYFIDQVRKECMKCHPSCKTCVGDLSQECLSCPDGFYLDGNDIGGGVFVGGCVSKCSQGYYKNTLNKKCMRCNINCIDCKDDQPDYCTECKIKLLWKDGTCYQNCPDGYWNDTPNKMCRKCDQKCNTCLGSPTFCTSCNGDYYYLEKQNDCLKDKCPDGMFKYKDASKGLNFCQKCHMNCLTCFAGDIDNCLSCDPAVGFLKGNVCAACNSNQYGDTKDQTCKPCNLNCTTCEGPNDDQCRSCSGSLFLKDKKCNPTCPDQTYPDISTHECAPCDSTCYKCSSAGPNSCKSCPSGRFLKGTVCQTTCDIVGEYPDTTNNVCGTCNSECLKCKDGTKLGCIECSSSKYLQVNQCVDSCLSNLFGLEETKQCLEECPQGYYGDSVSKKCLKCEAFCPICKASGFSNCEKCAGDLFLQDSQCLKQCKDGFYADKTDNICKKCHDNCLECQAGTENDCTKCKSKQFLGQNTCYTKCPNKQYGNQVNMNCVQECPLGTYGNQYENLCRACHSNCSQCYGSSYSQCYKCNLGHYLLDSTCDLCPSGYYKNDQQRTCDPCFDNCTQCDGGSPSDCLKCAYGYYHLKEQKMCVSTCPDPYYSEENNPDCILSCTQSNQYPNNITRKCENCNIACKECFGSDESSCKKCSTNYLFLEKRNMCTKKCPYGYYENYITFTCDPCDKTCQTCYGGSPDQCISCREPNFLFQNYCTDTCPQNLYKDLEILKCVEDCTQYKSNRFANQLTRNCQFCHSSCQKCTGPTNKECTQCTSSHLLLGTSCLDTCPLGYYAVYKDPNLKNSDQIKVTDDCQKCHQNCEDCYGPSESECRTCSKGLYTYHAPSIENQGIEKKTCVAQCPDQYIVNHQNMSCELCPPYTFFENGVCKNCHYSCIKCKGQTQFDCIKCTSERSIYNEGEPLNGQCNCKQGYMETFSHECSQLPIIATSMSKSIFVSLLTSLSCSIITGLLSTSAFSFHQLIEASYYTGYLKFANVTYPLNLHYLFESVSTDQSNQIFENKSQTSTQIKDKSRILISKTELLQSQEVGEAPQVWKKFIFTLVINISSWFIVLILNLAVIHMKVKYNQQNKLEKVRVLLQYTLPIQAFLRTSQEAFQFIFLSAYFSATLDVFGWLNFVYILITMLVVFGIIIKLSFLQLNEKKSDTSDKGAGEYFIRVKVKKNKTIDYPHPLRTLLYFFKDNKFARNYYTLMLLFKFSNVFVIVFTSNIVIQMVIMIITKLLFVIYLIICKPFKQKNYNYINIFNEILSCSIPLTILIMAKSEENEANYNAFGWLIFVEMIILFLFNFIYAVFELVMMLKIYITKKLKFSKRFIKINSEKQSDSADQSADNQSVLFEKNVLKNIQNVPLRIEEKNDFDKQNSPVKQHTKNNHLKVLQIGQTNQNLQSSCQSIEGPSIQATGTRKNIVHPECTIEIDKSQLENQNQSSVSKSYNQQEGDEEDFNLNSSNVKAQSILKEDYEYDENSENMGFPLSIYGKQLEQNQAKSPLKRKKRNKKKDEQKVQFAQEQEDITNKKSLENQTNSAEVSSQNNTVKSKQEEEDEQKQQHISQVIENVNDKLLKSNNGNIQPKNITERTSLDLIKVIEQESNSWGLKKKLSIKQKLQKMQQNPQKEVIEDIDESNGEKVITQVITKQKSDRSRTSDIVLNSSKRQKEDNSLKIIELNQDQKSNQAQQQQQIFEENEIKINSQKQIQNQNKNQKNQNIKNSSLKDSKSSKLNNDSKISNENKKDNIVFRNEGLFGGISEFKIKRVVQSQSTNTSPLKKVDSRLKEDKEDESKSILDFIKQKVIKQNLFKESK
ncbi:hypothetical protein TTHERM_00077020 (macronuclear) [Tetrahymena thermophila SB210]|uniref:Growth factor receptor domain-containing protein n=1 Tax=Tetrahymena thermophila (strain SB210) TaxID=312017 RepID=Q23G62_TETTS|nr:hypothetical protein TTHERM_00077020 [Tetrahymena thermophila SB210]EAR95398.3 hypothetical protein TTHERM_00077020 [Tetrahymena thermophila SB210]|eukprot:XP_001015643.3 hypothetical protein TTHERM_00077020 [Tetrahymena thermophila SB210]